MIFRVGGICAPVPAVSGTVLTSRRWRVSSPAVVRPALAGVPRVIPSGHHPDVIRPFVTMSVGYEDPDTAQVHRVWVHPPATFTLPAPVTAANLTPDTWVAIGNGMARVERVVVVA